MKWKEFVAEWLHFSRRDRIAIMTLVIFVTIVFFLVPLSQPYLHKKMVLMDTAWIMAMRELEKKDSGRSQKDPFPRELHYPSRSGYTFEKRNSPPKRTFQLFYFDPNRLAETGWEKLGLREKTIRTIQNYLGRGGHFYKPEDLRKVYGLFPDEYERLAPYVRIDPAMTDRTSPGPGQNNTRNPPESLHSKYAQVDINLADTSAFIALPGIGSKLAARIVNFREKLGGFYAVAQLAETFGLPDSTFQKLRAYFKLEDPSVRKLNINTATLDELKAHPYIRWTLANPIIAYRDEHGPFSRLEDIRNVMAVTEEIFMKILPYLALK